jgi:hypothetical protein
MAASANAGDIWTTAQPHAIAEPEDELFVQFHAPAPKISCLPRPVKHKIAPTSDTSALSHSQDQLQTFAPSTHCLPAGPASAIKGKVEDEDLVSIVVDLQCEADRVVGEDG